MALYSKCIVYVGPKQLTQETSMNLTRTTGSQPVKTVALGYAGESPGSSMCEIDVSNAVPSTDFELDPGSFMKDLSNASVTLFAAGRTITVDIFIYEDTFGHSVDQESKLGFKGRGSFPDWV